MTVRTNAQRLGLTNIRFIQFMFQPWSKLSVQWVVFISLHPLARVSLLTALGLD